MHVHVFDVSVFHKKTCPTATGTCTVLGEFQPLIPTCNYSYVFSVNVQCLVSGHNVS